MSKLGINNLLHNASATFARQLGSSLIQLLIITIIARVFGPSGNGAYTLALLLPSMLATMLNLGIGPANVYFINTEKISPLQAWKISLRLIAILSTLGLIVGGVIIHNKSSTFFPGVPVEMLWFALACYPILLTSTIISSFFQALQEFKVFNIILLLQPILNIIIITILIVTNIHDLFYILAAYFLSILMAQIVGYRLLKTILNKSDGPYDRRYYKILLNYGYKSHLSNIIAFLSNRADLLLLGFFSGTTSVGIYAIAINLTEKLWLIANSTCTVLLPRLSQLSNDEASRGELTSLTTRWVFWVTLIASLILILTGNYIIKWLFGEDFISAYTLLLILSPGIVAGSCSKVLANDFSSRGKPELNLMTSWIAVLLNIIGNFALIPKYGMNGAAISTSFSYFVNFLIRLVMHKNLTGNAVHKNFLIPASELLLVKNYFINKLYKK